MAYEFLKKLFGTPKDGEEPKAMNYAELDKKIQVVDVKAGGYVSKEKLDAKITELDGVKQQLSDANTTIQSYKDMDIDGIKQSAKDWETKYTQETQKLTAQLAAQERTHALDISYADAMNDTALHNEMYRAVRSYLANTGLLNRGWVKEYDDKQ